MGRAAGPAPAPVKRRGLTLPEVLVVAGVLGLLSTALMQIYAMSVAAYRQGSGRLALQGRARESMRRLEPILASAIPPNAVQQAIYSPLVGAPEAASMRWSSTEDLLGNTPVDPRAPQFRLYELAHDAGTGEVRLRQVQPVSPLPPRVMARQIARLRFEHTTLNTVRVRLGVTEPIKRADGTLDQVDFSLESLIQIPFYTSD